MQESLRQYEQMTDVLAKIYPSAPLFERAGMRHPVVIHHPQPQQIDDVNSVLGPVPTERESPNSLAFYNHALIQSLQNSGRNLFNGTTYVMKRIRTRPLTIEAQIGKYFDMVATAGTLEEELRDAVAAGGLVRLPMRSQYHRAVEPERALVSGEGRSAALGGGVLTVFNRGGDYYAILARRTARSATNPGFFHVLPAFMFQPMRDEPVASDWSLSHTIFRELLEELFGMPEVTDASPQYIESHPALQDLREMLAAGTASLHITGIAFNLMTLRPEFCAMLLIRDEGWWQRVTATDAPYRLDAGSETDDGKIKLVPIETDEAALRSLPDDVHARLPAHASAAIWLGMDLARSLL